MKINVRNIARELEPSLGISGVNAIDVKIMDKIIQLPMTVPNRVELLYAENAHNSLNPQLIQNVVRLNNIEYIRKTSVQNKIIKDGNSLQMKYPSALIDLYIQYPQENILTQNDRAIIHELQRKLKSKFISDYETDRNQDENLFEIDILTLRNDNPNSIIVPTIDLGIRPIGLFKKKLDKVMANNFDKVNVIYRSPLENINNWNALSRTIYGKNIWCNIVGITSRWPSRLNKLSRVSTSFLYGAHTVSMGVAWGGTPNAESHTLNPKTHYFQLDANGSTYEESRTISTKLLHLEWKRAREHILAGTFYTKYIPRRKGLREFLS
ncbi:hypothetical protein C5F47_08870 [Nitrosopumilus cobalaminigenes]|uniref:Uncharacterized protein n=1 Tax=Nitrosopumilus cobalaminigenes TaxID=1470066 RepID=A0A7D5R969_9ARCH|nr:hypothetical protein [Nitrosopumilus cobalaminigenes]QLH03641.1 hypothetical protein C5F47_08870 [Nitrosopumilus cobalaminigenes]